MSHFSASAHSASVSGIDRRAVLKATAWSVPVIAVAVATPLAAASVATPVVCTVVPVGEFVVSGGVLSDNGAQGTVPTQNGYFGTGWTPAKAPSGDAASGYTQTDAAVAPAPASWWQGGGEIDEPGFLSLDDHNNTAGAASDPVTVTLRFAAGVAAGVTYQFALPIYTSAAYLGTQHLDVSIAGAGVSLPNIVQGYVGDKTTSDVPAELSAYPAFSASQQPGASFTPTSDGTVMFTYTFTLSHVIAGQRQNADMLVQAPKLLSCA
ncbi:hypothetical protein ACNPNP_06535 [Microbacterium sp. AGC85]